MDHFSNLPIVEGTMQNSQGAQGYFSHHPQISVPVHGSEQSAPIPPQVHMEGASNSALNGMGNFTTGIVMPPPVMGQGHLQITSNIHGSMEDTNHDMSLFSQPHNSYYGSNGGTLLPSGMVSTQIPPMQQGSSFQHPHQSILLSQQQHQHAGMSSAQEMYSRQQQLYLPPNHMTSSQGGLLPLNMQSSGLSGLSGTITMQSQPHAFSSVQSHGISSSASPQLTQQQMLQHQQMQHQRQNVSGAVSSARNNTTRKMWHSVTDGDAANRKTMCDRIVALLQHRKPNAAVEWHEKLPHMAKRLEEALYNQASSLDEYMDSNTLKTRLQQLAHQMGGKQAAKHVPPTPDIPMAHPSLQVRIGNPQPIPQQPSTSTQQPKYPQYVPPQNQQQGQVYPQFPVQQNQRMPLQQQQLPSQIRPQQNSIQQFPNPLHGPPVSAYSNGSGIAYGLDGGQPTNHLMSSDGIEGQNMGMAPVDTSHPPQQIAQRFVNIAQINPLVGGQPPVPAPFSQVQNRAAGGAPSNSTHTDDHRNQVLKQQQQRLLLLRHASKCPHDFGKCTVTPHCAGMKQLWKHIMSCKDQECKIPHCVSSRYVLSHYSKCKDSNCPVCAPVREAIKRNFEQGRQIIRNGQGDVQRLAHDPSKRLKDGTIKPSSRQLQLDPVSCAIYCFTNEQIQAHIKSIHEGMRITATKVKEICLPILDEVLRLPHALAVFGSPVDPEMYNLPDYFLIVKAPMDLGTVRKRLDSLQYRDTIFFVEDVHLCFDNAVLYNPKGSEIHLLAKQLKKDFDVKFRQAMIAYERTIDSNRLNEEACAVCGEIKLNFEPPVYYCNGRCGQRIRRHAYFYSTSNNMNHWCVNCFGELRDNQPIRLADMTITKSELAKSKKKHSEESEESWVECDKEVGCGRWVHSICGLFNARLNFSDDVRYMCPSCLIDKRKKNQGIVAALKSKTRASDLPKCNLTDFMEGRIAERLELAYQETAEIMGIPVAQVEKCPQLVLRQVSSIDKMQTVRDGVQKRYQHKNYPSEFPCRVKCVVLFQNIDGQDVVLFGMYVYEYGHKCPAPNQRRVYISYLDSVHYFRPKRYRTVVYHEILTSYLEYVKKRGFHTAHIWSCPPSKGDDYIFYCHPIDQKTPKTDKLQKWYADMLESCVQRGIAHELTDLHTEFLVDPQNDATVLPYFEGDYWTTEAEVIISSLNEPLTPGAGAEEEEEEETIQESGTKSKRKVKSKAKLVRATRSSKSAVFSKSERDPVVAKLASIIEPMKNTFFVARLYPREYAENFAASRQQELITEEADSNPEGESARIEKELQEDASMLSVPTTISKVPAGQDVVIVSVEKEEKEENDFEHLAQFVSSESDATDSSKVFQNQSGAIAMEIDSREGDQVTEQWPSKVSSIDRGDAECKDEISSAESKEDSDFGARSKKIKIERDDSKEIGADAYAAIVVPAATLPEVPPNSADSSSSAGGGAISGDSGSIPKSGGPQPSDKFLECLKDDTEDVDDTQECEHWDTRQAFLNLCQGNHYQFDQLRRGKYTSMMVLYLMHNPDAPKFVPNCNCCHKDILVGARFRCDSCDIDFCSLCHSQQGPRIHNHPLRSMTDSSQSKALTEQQRRDRQHSLQLHIELLAHATECADPLTCKVKNCSKMKDFVAHIQSCPASSKGCPICKRVNMILTVHARKCKKDNCRVFRCLLIREKMRNMALRQQQMDDRRRAMINEMYHSNGSSVASAARSLTTESED